MSVPSFKVQRRDSQPILILSRSKLCKSNYICYWVIFCILLWLSAVHYAVLVYICEAREAPPKTRHYTIDNTEIQQLSTHVDANFHFTFHKANSCFPECCYIWEAPEAICEGGLFIKGTMSAYFTEITCCVTKKPIYTFRVLH